MKTGVLAALFLLSVGSAAAGGYPEVSDDRLRRYMEQLPNVDVLDTEPRYNGGDFNTLHLSDFIRGSVGLGMGAYESYVMERFYIHRKVLLNPVTKIILEELWQAEGVYKCYPKLRDRKLHLCYESKSYESDSSSLFLYNIYSAQDGSLIEQKDISHILRDNKFGFFWFQREAFVIMTERGLAVYSLKTWEKLEERQFSDMTLDNHGPTESWCPVSERHIIVIPLRLYREQMLLYNWYTNETHMLVDIKELKNWWGARGNLYLLDVKLQDSIIEFRAGSTNYTYHYEDFLQEYSRRCL